MSIIDDQKKIIKLGTLHSWMFTISLYLIPVAGGWMVQKVLAHDTEIAVMRMQVARMERKLDVANADQEPKKFQAWKADPETQQQ